MNTLMHPRCATDTCVRCRKKLVPAARVQTAMIVESSGRNPTTREMGAFLSAEFELVHIDCNDPFLSAPIVVAA